MLKLVSGDILLSNAQAIAHGIAPGDHFNQGLALALRERYPAMAKDFRHYCQVAHPKTGEVWAWAGADGKRIVCLLTQEAAQNNRAHPGAATTHNVNVALRALRNLVEAEKFTSLALPRLATGVGGLKWEEVLPLIQTHLGDLDIPVEVYETWQSGVQAG
ncbi:MAG: macro domain-containing protein [Pseudomonadales bacterium]|nr:macro domain-containing protein [Pseudomonadales bacterium]